MRILNRCGRTRLSGCCSDNELQSSTFCGNTSNVNLGGCNSITCPRGATGPQGPQGETGPAGPAGVSETLVTANTTSQTVAPDGLIDLGSAVNTLGTNITYTAPNTITLGEGTYNIMFSAIVSNTTSTPAGATIFVDGVAVSTAQNYVTGSTDPSQVVVQHSLNVADGTNLTFVNDADSDNTYNYVFVTVTKLA